MKTEFLHEDRQLREQLHHVRIAEPIAGPFTNTHEHMSVTALRLAT